MNNVYLVYHNAGKEYPLKETEANIIGRGIEGESALASIVLPHPSISREHASITFYKDVKRWIFKNLSRYPSTVSGTSVTDQKELKHGDEIRIGPFSFSFFEKSLALEDTMELPMMKPPEQGSFVNGWEDEEKTPLGSAIETFAIIFFILLSVFLFYCCFVW
ncbi:FHA domain-containing protein [Candidatus Uabimicrobium sp. HlEnr_7]|uniref:FHA domain-containing protein n=1 Tax=Candidatus Uabimicrobium helgolandensis TaxID=3095367 RepID=UPI0035568F3D